MIVTVSIFSVQAGVSPEAGCSTSLEEEASFVMSQKTVRRASTLAASNIATVVPSAAPAVLAANTVRISDQGGGCPWISSVSYPPSACILEIFSPIRR